VSGIAAAERESLPGQLRRRYEELAAPSRNHRAEVGVDVAHAEQAGVAADPLFGRHVGGIGVPADVDLAREKRLDETLVVRVEDVVGRDAGLREVVSEPLPDRDDPRVVRNGPDEQRVAAHGTGSPASALPIQVRSTALVGAITDPARASRRWRSTGSAGV
jgi:hypothetical protein